MTLFFYYFSMGIFGSILSVYLAGIGKTTGEISFVISGSHIFAFAIMPLVSYIYDRVKKSYIVTYSVLALAAISGLAFACFQSTWLLFLFNGLSMSLVQCVAPICEQLCTTGKYRYGSVRVWGAAGYAASAQLAGIIYQFLAPVFLFIFFALTIAMTILGYWGAKEDRDLSEVRQNKPQDTQNAKFFWCNRNFILFLVVSFVFAGVTGLNSTYIPMLLVERGQTVAQAGTILFLGTMLEIPLILLSGKFMDYFKNKTLLVTAFVILILQFSIYGFGETVISAILSAILLKSMATMLFIMITMKVVINVIDERFIISALGLTATIKSLGSVMFQNAGGFYMENRSLNMLYIILAAFSIIGLILSLNVKINKSKVIFQ